MITCHHCNKSYNNKASVQRHIKYAHSEHPRVPCDICSKEFSERDAMMRHRASHQPSHQCDECGRMFATLYSVTRHYNIQHKNTGGYDCRTCGKRYTSQVSLSAHMVKHGAPKPFTCKVCMKMFVQKKTWKIHVESGICLKKAEGDNKYSCDTCGKCFIKPRYLRQHKRVHQDPKLHCVTCGKLFHWRSCLRRHMRFCTAS